MACLHMVYTLYQSYLYVYVYTCSNCTPSYLHVYVVAVSVVAIYTVHAHLQKDYDSVDTKVF